MAIQTAKDFTTYMHVAELHAMLSKAERKKVGACLVTKSGIIIPGYNGTPSGMDNTCEEELIDDEGKVTTVTKPTVIHAELNCILKAAKEGVSIADAVLYVTLMPCLACSAMITQVGIKKVFYKEDYRSTTGAEYLKSAGIHLIKLTEGN